MSDRMRALSFVLLLFLAAIPTFAAPAPKPTAKQIAEWIEQLGDNRFAARENASKKLWEAGAAAEEALEKARKSEDVEVARRARDILDKFKWGIYPDTPADIVALIRTYQSAQGSTRAETVEKLLDSGPAGLQAVRKIARAETDWEQRKFLGAVVAAKLPAALPQMLENRQYEKFEALLELSHESGFLDHTQYIAYWLLRGKLDERIEHFRSVLAKSPKATRAAETLVYLHRAKGEMNAARQAAEQAGRDDLLEGVLIEMADWKALAARRDVRRAQNEMEKAAFRVTFSRLAGNSTSFERALADLGKYFNVKADNTVNSFMVVKTFLLNDRFKEGMDLLAKRTDQRATLFDILCARLQYREAFALSAQATPAEKGHSWTLDLAEARTLYLLGEREKAHALFTRCAGQIKDGVDDTWVHDLISEEYRAGRKDLAFEHLAKALSVSLNRSNTSRILGDSIELIFDPVFSKQTRTATVWWQLLRQRFKDEPAARVLKRLRDLMEGKTPAPDVKRWIAEADNGPSEQKGVEAQEDWSRKREALAEAALLAGLDELAHTLLAKADSTESLIRLGDLLAGKKQWAKAAERYRQAWSKSRTSKVRMPGTAYGDPLPMYLAGDALRHSGAFREGDKLMEQAHWLPLGNFWPRNLFLRALAERGFEKAAQREADFLSAVCALNSDFSVSYWQAVAALRRKDYLHAADNYDRSMLSWLRAGTRFTQSVAYVILPSQMHQVRASALLARGQLAEARRHIDLALEIAPGNVELPIAVVPELERLGHKKEAAALFERCFGAYANVCRDYPRCAHAHNSAAWMSACCRRNLDSALEHARKAVELAPDNAGFLDTLAEVHFQRGEKERAVVLQKRVVELDPKKSYFRKQLLRLEAGDPSAERPPEDPQ